MCVLLFIKTFVAAEYSSILLHFNNRRRTDLVYNSYFSSIRWCDRMWLWVPLDLIQHLFVPQCHLETSSLMSDMLLPTAAFQLSISQGSSAAHSIWNFNADTEASGVPLICLLDILWLVLYIHTTAISSMQTCALYLCVLCSDAVLSALTDLHQRDVVMNTRDKFSDVVTR